jgi:hypothetical protein
MHKHGANISKGVPKRTRVHSENPLQSDHVRSIPMVVYPRHSHHLDDLNSLNDNFDSMTGSAIIVALVNYYNITDRVTHSPGIKSVEIL